MKIEPESYLTTEGKAIFNKILDYCIGNGTNNDIDTYELSILANSIDIHARCAEEINRTGGQLVISVGSKGYTQVSPYYSIMNKEYATIIKHSIKFGLNPTDRDKLLKGKPKAPEKKDGPLGQLMEGKAG